MTRTSSLPSGTVASMSLQCFDPAADHRQQVIEIVRDAAGQVPDGLHLLRLTQRFLGLRTLRDLLRNPLFQLLVSQSQRIPGVLPQPREFKVRSDPGQQFARRERLDQVVVGAPVEPFDPCFLTRPGGQQNHRQVPQLAVRPNAGQQAKPVHSRHHHVGQDQVRRICHRGAQSRLPVAHRLDLISRAQQPHDIIAHVGIIVGKQNSPPSGPVRDTLRAQATPACWMFPAYPHAEPRRPRTANAAPLRRRSPRQFPPGVLRPAVSVTRSGRQMRTPERYPHRHRRAAVDAAIHRDRAAMQPNQFTHQRQTDTGAFKGPAALALDTVEAIEDMRQFRLGNADAGIAHGQHRRV